MSKNKIKEKKPFQFTKKSIIALIFVSIAGILSGIFVGGFFIGAPQVDYSQYNEADLRDDTKALSQRAQGKAPSAFKAYEVFEIAEQRMFTHGSVYVTGLGEVKTISNQKILSTKAYENGTYFKESVSKGLKSVGERDYYTEGGSTLHYYSATGITDELTANWKDKGNREIADFHEVNGVPMTSFIPYIVSSKTVLNKSEMPKQITLENGSKAYEVVVELDSILSVLNYVKQMKNISQLPNYPTFSSITLTCVIDEEFKFISIDTYEKYTVNYMGVNAGCTGILREDFTYGGKDIIPVTK